MEIYGVMIKEDIHILAETKLTLVFNYKYVLQQRKNTKNIKRFKSMIETRNLISVQNNKQTKYGIKTRQPLIDKLWTWDRPNRMRQGSACDSCVT